MWCWVRRSEDPAFSLSLIAKGTTEKLQLSLQRDQRIGEISSPVRLTFNAIVVDSWLGRKEKKQWSNDTLCARMCVCKNPELPFPFPFSSLQMVRWWSFHKTQHLNVQSYKSLGPHFVLGGKNESQSDWRPSILAGTL